MNITNVTPELHLPCTVLNTPYLPLQFTDPVTRPTLQVLLFLAPREQLIAANVPTTLTLSLTLHCLVLVTRKLIVGRIPLLAPVRVLVLSYESLELLAQT